MTRRSLQAGMTLIEVAVAIAVLAIMSGLLFQIIGGTIKGRDTTMQELATPKVENAVLGQIFKDFRYLWFGGLVGDAGFVGKDGTRAGKDADQVHFITARPSRVASIEDGSTTQRQGQRASPLTEVGYAFRINDEDGDGLWLEMWRREDYFVDSNPTEGGVYSMVYDKIRSFSLRYYPPPDESTEKSGLDEWDSRIRKSLPYAIILEMQLDVENRTTEIGEDRQAHHVTRIILLRGAYNVRWTTEDDGGNGNQPGR